MPDDPLQGFERVPFSHEGKTRDVYRRGEGPAVIVIAEMPGITPKVLAFAEKVADLGCTAVLPHLFGVPGADALAGNPLHGATVYARGLIPACIGREFTIISTGQSSPVVTWLRALAKAEHERCGGPGVGAVGMCFTGGFALAMAADDRLLAPVLSQPSLPFPVSKKHKADIGISDADLARVKQRTANGVDVLGLRFTCDRLSPGERFETLRRELGDRFIGVEIDSSKDNPHGLPKAAHSVLTEHLVDEPGHPTHDALQQVLDLFRTKLLVS
jgi:dienelactone hydrolase